MRLLDRYVLRELLVPLFYCLVGFQVFWLAFDLYSHLDEYRAMGLTPALITQLCVMKLPELLTTVLPVALLLALLYTLTNHARHNELVAMRAAGVSLARICWPYLGVGLVFAAVLFGVTELLGPRASARATELTGGTASRAAESDWRGPMNIMVGEGASRQTIENARFNIKTGGMTDFVAELATEGGGRQKFLPHDDGTRAEWKQSGWMFYRVIHQIYEQGSDFPQEEKLMDAIHVAGLRITPDDLRAQARIDDLRRRFETDKQKIGKHLLFTVSELRGFERTQTGLAPDDPLYAQVRTQLHGRLAQPWMCVVVVLIALPFGAFFGRRSAFAGVAASVVLCLAYFILFRIGLALGTGGKLAPMAAAWLPNAIFAAIGLGLSWRLR